MGLTSQGQGSGRGVRGREEGSEDQGLTLLGEWVKGQSFEKYRQLDLTKSNEVHLLNWHWVSSLNKRWLFCCIMLTKYCWFLSVVHNYNTQICI